MTLLEPDAPEGLQGPPVPVLETERLILRAPRFEDAATIAALVNDRRIAENTLRHPYTLADAQAFLTAANASGGEIVFLITAWEGTVAWDATRRSIAARSRETMRRCGCRRRSGSFGMARRCCTLGRAAENSRMSTRC